MSKRILFMCVANSARSQLAEGLARALLGSDYEVASAGSQPGTLNPHAVAVLAELGIDISGHYAKSFDELPKGFSEALDLVITLCAEEVCPRLPLQVKHLHWPLPDPAAHPADATADLAGDEDAARQRFRSTREALRKKISSLRQLLA